VQDARLIRLLEDPETTTLRPTAAGSIAVLDRLRATYCVILIGSSLQRRCESSAANSSLGIAYAAWRARRTLEAAEGGAGGAVGSSGRACASAARVVRQPRTGEGAVEDSRGALVTVGKKSASSSLPAVTPVKKGDCHPRTPTAREKSAQQPGEVCVSKTL